MWVYGLPLTPIQVALIAVVIAVLLFGGIATAVAIVAASGRRDKER